MEVDLLKQIIKNMAHKTLFQIIVSCHESKVTTRLNPSLELDGDKEYEIALVNLKPIIRFQTSTRPTCLFIPPITVIPGLKIKIPEGSYQIDDINNTIKHEMEKTGHYHRVSENYYINISANSNTLKSVLILKKDYQIDFNHRDSLAKVLGFTGAKYTGGFHEWENVVNILKINSIPVNIDSIAGSDEKYYLLLFSES